MRIYNTAARKKENFIPLQKHKVKLYCCGPTVYHYAHIGNLRSYIFEDILVRTLRSFDFDVTHVMNITDVGHLTDDGDEGEDKLEVGARREGKTVWEVAEHYTDAFLADLKKLNIEKPTHTPKATEYIKEQVAFIAELETKGFTYTANGNVYFDTSQFKDYGKFAKLNLDAEKKSRVAKDPHKKNDHDFVLWFTKSKFKNHTMQWESPWGKGYPGWHIECSTMAKALLGETIDIHCGGIDHVPVHHTNEIAQSECCHKKQFAKYWMHNEFLVDSGGKMAKSRGEFLTLSVLIEKGYDPLAYRYLCLLTHYRKQLMFSFKALDSATTALNRLREKTFEIQCKPRKTNAKFLAAFNEAMGDDLNTPKALAVLHEMLGDKDLADSVKYATMLDFDTVLGLDLQNYEPGVVAVPAPVHKLVEQRQKAREQKDFAKSDELRDKIAKLGFTVKDTKNGQTLVKN